MIHRSLLMLVFSVVLIVSIREKGQGEPSNPQTGDTHTFTLPGGATMEMVWIPPGTFMMGTTEKQKQWMIYPRALV